MKYHLSEINKGTIGESSKIQEELDELNDVIKQNCKIMILLELSDILGAVEEVAKKYNCSLNDLIIMSDITKRARK